MDTQETITRLYLITLPTLLGTQRFWDPQINRINWAPSKLFIEENALYPIDIKHELQ